MTVNPATRAIPASRLVAGSGVTVGAASSVTNGVAVLAVV
jgi:hypothetical protein